VHIRKLADSGLKLNQVINAIKTFILPRLDYFMMNSVMSFVELKKLDLLVRKAVNGLDGGRPLSKDMFYSSRKYGGLGIRYMRDRYAVCKMNNVTHFPYDTIIPEGLSHGN
jgi:hypothetical protein